MERVRACVERLQTSGHAFYRERRAGLRAGELRSLEDLDRLIELVAAGTLPRSEGKAVRVIDRRARGD